MDIPNISLGEIPKLNKAKPAPVPEKPDNDGEREVSVDVSPICSKDGKKLAYVRFTDGNRYAEGEIPDCRITDSRGYSQEELEALVKYMKSDLGRLKKMAAGINLLDAIMGRN